MELLKRLTDLTRSAGAAAFPTAGATGDTVLRRLLKRPAEVNLTATSLKVYKAVIPAKIEMIDKLPAKYRQGAQESVWNAVTRGYDVLGLARELEDRFGLGPERAKLTAAAQCKMAQSVIENTQLIESGLTEAVWSYDAVRCTVPAHQALDGKRYALARGVDLDAKRVWPSSEPPCFCASVPIDEADKVN